MTRKDITEQFSKIEKGIIRDPGKFEGDILYAPYFWDEGLNGMADADIGSIWFFVVHDLDRAEFPELGMIYGLALEESDNGFCYVTEYQTIEEFDQATAEADAHEYLNTY